MLRKLVFGMTCREVADFLGHYLDGDLPKAQRRAFDRHLFWCRACVAYVESYRATVRLARSLGRQGEVDLPAPPPESLVQAVLEARRMNGGR